MNKNILIGGIIFASLILMLITNLVFKTPPENISEQTTDTQSEISSNEASSVVPFYPNATTKISVETSRDSNNKRIFYAYTLETTDSINDINDWYRTALNSNGWSIKSDEIVGSNQLIQGENGNLQTSMQATNNQTSGVVTISQQAQIVP